jgi:hypothetical protein
MREIALVVCSGLIAIFIFRESLFVSTPQEVNRPEQFILHQASALNNNSSPFTSDETKEVEITGASTMSYDFDNVLWPQLKDALCPNMVPNVQSAKKRLLHLARRRLHFLEHYEEHVKKDEEKDDVYQRFFEFHASINAYSPDKSDMNNTVMAYVPVWKCANEQIRFGMVHTLGEDKFEAYGGNDFCLFFQKQLPKMSTRRACVVTAVRDPISHFLSAYNEVEYRYSLHKFTDEWKEFPQLIFTRYRHGHKKRFEQFVRDYLSGPIVEKQKPYLDYPLEIPHTFLMSGILLELARCNERLTDYLPSLDNLTHTWPNFLTKTCPEVDFPEEFVTGTLDTAGQHFSSTDDLGDYDAARQVWEEGGLTAQALCILHVMDYACFDKLEIPEVCKQVYNDKAFVKALTN